MVFAQTNQKNDFESMLNEAEIYHSMGMNSDSKGTYERILSAFPELPSHSRKKIIQKINSLKNKISELDRSGQDNISVQHMDIIKKTLSSNNDAHVILNSATAFQELGLYKESIAEYRKLLDFDYPLEKIVVLITGDLLQITSSSKTMEQVEDLIC